MPAIRPEAWRGICEACPARANPAMRVGNLVVWSLHGPFHVGRDYVLESYPTGANTEDLILTAVADYLSRVHFDEHPPLRLLIEGAQLGIACGQHILNGECKNYRSD